LGISEDEWALLIKTLGRIKNIQTLILRSIAGYPGFHLFQAVADAVNNAQSLRKLVISPDWKSFPTRDLSGMIPLAKALREHTALEDFTWVASSSHVQLEAEQSAALDPVLRSLQACSHLRKVDITAKCAITAAMKSLLQLQSTTELLLVLNTEQWLAAAKEIRRGRCNVQRLILSLVMHQGTTSDATEAVKAVASAIRLDPNLEHLTLEVEEGFTDEAGVALAEALTVNKTLRKITLSTDTTLYRVHNKAYLGAQAYEAFSAMLRVNTSLSLELPAFRSAGGGQRLLESHKQMIIEQRLDKAGRGRLLASRQTIREEWVDALHELSSYDDDDDTDSSDVSCLFSLLRLNPAIYVLRVDNSFDSGEWKIREDECSVPPTECSN
jgi:hypothetical protein